MPVLPRLRYRLPGGRRHGAVQVGGPVPDLPRQAAAEWANHGVALLPLGTRSCGGSVLVDGGAASPFAVRGAVALAATLALRAFEENLLYFFSPSQVAAGEVAPADEHLPAVLWSAHGGQEYGHALAAVLCGDADPGGRLTQTWYRDAAELPDLLDYDIIAADATYLYYRGSALYPFGHGLSYTTFTYGEPAISSNELAASADAKVKVSVEVSNTGSRDGEEVVQLYIADKTSTDPRPLKDLRGFERIYLGAGEKKTVEFELSAQDLAYWHPGQKAYVATAGNYDIMVGSSSAESGLKKMTLTVK